VQISSTFILSSRLFDLFRLIFTLSRKVNSKFKNFESPKIIDKRENMLKKGLLPAIFVALFAYKFHFRPVIGFIHCFSNYFQVDHAPDYLRRAVAHNIWNSIFFLTEKIRSVTSSKMAIGFMNKAMMPTPTNENTIEDIIGRS